MKGRPSRRPFSSSVARISSLLRISTQSVARSIMAIPLSGDTSGGLREHSLDAARRHRFTGIWAIKQILQPRLPPEFAVLLGPQPIGQTAGRQLNVVVSDDGILGDVLQQSAAF